MVIGYLGSDPHQTCHCFRGGVRREEDDHLRYIYEMLTLDWADRDPMNFDWEEDGEDGSKS